MADPGSKTTRGGGALKASRLLLPLLALGLTSCNVLSDSTGAGDSLADPAAVAAVAGWTRIAVTNHYLLVVNVLPGEEMFTSEEISAKRPTEGEEIIHGVGEPVGPEVRHIEAHVYDRSTGLPVSDVTTTIHVFNRTTGEHAMVSPTLMQDVNVGAHDIHYGNNVPVRGDSDLSLTVTVGDEEVTVDGHLD